PLTPLPSLLGMMPDAQRFVAYCDPSVPRLDMARECLPSRDTLILIGPEGDFDPTEIRATLDAGFVPVTLGDNRLRTETAALYAVSVVHIADTIKAR
ncbi:MAG: RNA methyltransferase, partial [Duncaniella sp.]|nr:RNA methyltransferase [Duncaniella sp.]